MNTYVMKNVMKKTGGKLKYCFEQGIYSSITFSELFIEESVSVSKSRHVYLVS